MFGGVTTATLCGIQSAIRADAADLNVGDDVTCKVCNAILRGDRRAFGKQFVGLSSQPQPEDPMNIGDPTRWRRF